MSEARVARRGQTSARRAFASHGTALLGQPFLGGVLWPDPVWMLPMPRVGADGRTVLAGTWPAGTSGTQVVLQAGFPDAGGAQGWASTTGVLGLAPWAGNSPRDTRRRFAVQ